MSWKLLWGLRVVSVFLTVVHPKASPALDLPKVWGFPSKLTGCLTSCLPSLLPLLPKKGFPGEGHLHPTPEANLVLESQKLLFSEGPVLTCFTITRINPNYKEQGRPKVDRAWKSDLELTWTETVAGTVPSADTKWVRMVAHVLWRDPLEAMSEDQPALFISVLFKQEHTRGNSKDQSACVCVQA